jgi:hypothetical protein
VEQSSATADTNLPKHEVCEQCHIDGSARSAGANCVLCHLYHDTSKDPAVHLKKRKEVPLEKLDVRSSP